MQILKTIAIKNFLTHMTHKDLTDLYNSNMEVQVNVAQDGGNRVDGDFKGRMFHAWSDGMQTWKSFRIPFKANTEPEFDDTPMNWDLAQHAEAIGMTGWNWKEKKSIWVGFDFDAITGHSPKHSKKLSESELDELKSRLSSIPWVTTRKSTSGKGVHVYIFVTPVSTQNHQEHAALARSILAQMGALAQYDFQAKVDVCGHILWQWHRKMQGTDGLTLIKQGTVLESIPQNWKEHVPVIKGTRKKSLPAFIEQSEKIDEDKLFEELCITRPRVQLDAEHTKLVNWLRDHNSCAWWDSDHWMLVTHTHHLKTAHKSLSLKGIFETLAQGTEAPNDHNCYLFPLSKGAWSVRRYSQGVAEANTWHQDKAGWTVCNYNKPSSFKEAIKIVGGVERPEGGYTLKTKDQASDLTKLLGAQITLPDIVAQYLAKESKDGRLVLEFEGLSPTELETLPTVAKTLESWSFEKKKWRRIFDTNNEESNGELVLADNVIRHLVSVNGEDAGWVVFCEGGWKSEPLTHVREALKTLGYNTKDAANLVGTCILKPWTLVNRPFEEEYLPNRCWNRKAAQLKHKPSENKENLKYPTWMKVLDHCGKSLDEALKSHPWALDNCVLTGADYLKLWISSVFQFPLESLPYLFFYGEQNSGKSSFHEAISMLVTSGVVRAENALTDKYNGELANAIVCIIEEVDLRSNKAIYNKIKDYVTSKTISIRAIYEQAYNIVNTTHWLQFSNSHLHCPVFSGDTRITVLRVDPLKSEIPRKEMTKLLEEEANDFLAEILSLELPKPIDRLNIPVIVTDEKILSEKSSQSLVEIWLSEFVYFVPGELIKYSEFFDRFFSWLDQSDRFGWTKIKFGKELNPKYVKGRVMGEQAQFYIGNCSWKPYNEITDGPPKKVFRVKNDILIQE